PRFHCPRTAMSRKARFIVVALVLLAFFGYRQLRDRPGDAPADNAAVAAGPAPAPAPPRMFGDIAFRPCTLPSPAGAGVPGQCGSREVGEEPARPRGRRIALDIGWTPAGGGGGGGAPDPVFLLAGGPGQSAKGSYPMVAAAFREVLKDR